MFSSLTAILHKTGFIVLSLMLLVFIFNLQLLQAEEKEQKKSPMVVKKVTAKFADMKGNIEDVIKGKGLHLSHILDASDMLNRTGKDFDVKENLYQNASIIEFCSAKISHDLSQADPNNITLCPFAISIYTLTKEPDNVYFVYRLPFISEKSNEATTAMTKLLQEIVTEAIEW